MSPQHTQRPGKLTKSGLQPERVSQQIVGPCLPSRPVTPQSLDDVGIDERSLALMPFLAPDVIKLDMSLIQERRPTPASARVLNSVAAEAERTGAVLLAEGIDTEAHLARARAVGATLGQGWYFGRPGALPAPLPEAPAGAVPARVNAI